MNQGMQIPPAARDSKETDSPKASRRNVALPHWMLTQWDPFQIPDLQNSKMTCVRC